MKCNNCGFEFENELEYCSNCGAARGAEVVNKEPITNSDNAAEVVNQVPTISLNNAADKVLGAIKDKLFLIICILLSISCVLSFAGSEMPLIILLAVIFLWIIYSGSKNNIADPKNLRSLSGVVYANYVIVNVLCIILFVAGSILAIAFEMIIEDPEFISELSTEINSLGDLGLGISNQELIDLILSIPGFAIFIVFGIGAAVAIVINVLSMRKIHRFVKSTYESVISGELKLMNVNGAKNWLMVLGIFAVIGSVGAIPEATMNSEYIIAAADALGGVVMILASVLINNHFVAKVGEISAE